MSVQLLDCTLRDGAHINHGNFSHSHIVNITRELTESFIDIVELGFLKNVPYNPEVSYYPHIEDAYDIIKNLPTNKHTEYALMARADEYDISLLSECNGRIGLIRIAFYYDFLEGAVKFAKELRARGYQFTFNLINTPGCTEDELDNVIKQANDVKPRILTIVDTFGVLHMTELKDILERYLNKLDPEIKIGLHVHENMSLAFSLAQGFIEYAQGKRDIVVDASLMGIGRIPGNLCVELLADYMNAHCEKTYHLFHILRAINDDIIPIREKMTWGYSPAYFLSARQRVHRSYSEYLLERGFTLNQIETLLGCIKPEQARKFNKSYIDSIIKETFN